MTNEFERAFDRLNAVQRQAVEQVYGPVLVLAGPGTGKTQMLTTRIASILEQTDAQAENILCLTFTESAAVEMRERLQRWIGPDAYRVKIATFHGFCQWVMDQYPEIFYPLFGAQEIADDLQKALLYRQVIQSRKWEYFSSIWDEFVHQYDFLSAISSLKRENLNPAGLRDLLPAERTRLEADPDNFYKRKFKEFQVGDWKPQAREKVENKLGKMAELADLWEAYEVALGEAGLYDFDDLINRVVTQLKTNENLRLDLQEKFQWLLVDEYQDTNNSQNAILWQLTEGVEQPNLFAVGDDDQSIYRFQGASVANIKAFRAKFPKRLEVNLQENYRSHQSILDAAYAVVEHNLDRASTEKKLLAQKTDFQAPHPGKIIRAELPTQFSEIAWLVKTIETQLAAGIPPQEIAILVRKNREIAELARELPKFGIPVSAQIFADIFQHETVRQLILMLQIFADAKHDEKFFDLLHADFLQIEPSVLLRLSLDKPNGESIVKSLLEQPSDNEQLQRFFDFFMTARRDFHHCRPPVLAEKFLYESGLAEFMTAKKRTEDWQHVRKFIAWIREQNQTDLNAVLERIELHQSLGIPVRPDPLPRDKQAIQIMTAHKSKGQEFEVVLVPGLQDRKWGNPRSGFGMALPQLNDQVFEENDEERRLFFVALTRAKAQVYLSFHQTDFGGRAQSPSQFWHELPDSLVEDLATESEEAALQELLPVFFTQTEKTLTNAEKEILLTRVRQFVWSASSLQVYLDCPRQFLYQYLYRFPRRPLPQMALGVSLHQALERFFKTLLQKPDAGPAVLLGEYEHALAGQNIPREQYDDFLDHGREILQTYYDQKLQNFQEIYPHGYLLEHPFGIVELEGLRLTGTMDKVVFLDDKKTQAKIIDYKSGRPKAIKPGESYWRQLVFYDLLAHHSTSTPWRAESGVIEFLTPDANGKLGTRELSVTSQDRQQVIDELKASQVAIESLSFPLVPNPLGSPDIDYWQNFGQ